LQLSNQPRFSAFDVRIEALKGTISIEKLTVDQARGLIAGMKMIVLLESAR
jgi:hypothetical protein